MQTIVGAEQEIEGKNEKGRGRNARLLAEGPGDKTDSEGVIPDSSNLQLEPNPTYGSKGSGVNLRRFNDGSRGLPPGDLWHCSFTPQDTSHTFWLHQHHN